MNRVLLTQQLTNQVVTKLQCFYSLVKEKKICVSHSSYLSCRYLKSSFCVYLFGLETLV